MKSCNTFQFLILSLAAALLTGCGGDGGLLKNLSSLNPSPVGDSKVPGAAVSAEGPVNSCQPKSLRTELAAIYDGDDRKPIEQLPRFLPFADRLAGLVPASNVSNDGTLTPLSSNGLRSFVSMCSSEPFSSIPVVAGCSGSLVAANLVVTAAHCVETLSACKASKYVFNLSYSNKAGDPRSNEVDAVYTCDSLPYSRVDDIRDIALVRLDRQVKGKLPFKINLTENLQSEDPLVCIGQSEGLPLMVSPVGSFKGMHRDYLMHNVDTFGGNSGAAVFSGETVVGVHAQRAFSHYVSNGSCQVRQAASGEPEENGRTPATFWAKATDTKVLKSVFENSVVGLTGRVTALTKTGSNLTVEGWACALARQDAINVEIQDASGNVIETVSAGENLSDEDEGFCQSGATHNFRVLLPAQDGLKFIAKYGGEEMELVIEEAASAPETPSEPGACP